MKRKSLFLTIGLPLLMLAGVIVLLLLVSLGSRTFPAGSDSPETAATAQGDAEESEPANGPSASAFPGLSGQTAGGASVLAQGQSTAEPELVLSAEEPAFLPADLPEPPADFVVGQGLLRHRFAKITFEPSAAVAQNPGHHDERPQPADRVFTFELFPGTTFLGIAQTHQQHAAATPRGVYVGELAGYPGSIFTLAYNEGHVAGYVEVAGRGRYVLSPAGPDLVRVGEVDTAKLQNCRPGPVPSASGLSVSANSSQQISGYSTGSGLVTAAATGTTIDVLIVYSNLAANRFNGVSGLQAVVDSDFAFANQSLANSQIPLFLRQAGFQSVNYTDSGSLDVDLDYLTFAGDGVLEDVRERRKNSGADLVSLYIDLQTTNSPFIILGLAWVVTDPDDNEFGYSVVRPQLGPVTFVHEVGHNLGCLHDRENSFPIAGTQPYSHGWRFVGNDGQLYRTIMAYQPGTNIPHFSNPNVLFSGQPTGVPKGDASAAFNAATITENMAQVANFSNLPDDPFTFQTLAPPFNLRASEGLFERHVQLEWNGVGPGYRVLRSLNSNIDNAIVLDEFSNPGVGAIYVDETVLNGLEYYYWVRTIDGFGQFSEAVGPVKGFSRDFGVSEPDGVHATRNASKDYVRVSWDPLGEKNGYDLSYEILRADNLDHTSGTLISLRMPFWGPREYEDTDALPGVEYYYWVRGIYQKRSDPSQKLIGDAGGPVIGIRKLPPFPQKVSGLKVTDGTTYDDIRIRWNASANTTQYEIWRSTEDIGVSRSQIAVIEASAPREYKDNTAEPGVQYYYWMRAVNEVFESEFTGPEEGKDPASPRPGTPDSVNATGDKLDKVVVTWGASGGADNYVIYRSETPNFPDAQVIANGNLPYHGSQRTYDDTDNLVLGVTYYYWVAGVNVDGLIGPPGGPDEGGLGRQPPPPPGSVSASDGTFLNYVAVSWSMSPTATSYRVYRWGDNQTVANAKLLGETSELVFRDETAVPDVVYNYAVRAKNGSGLGDFSEPDTGFIFLLTDQPPFAPTGIQASDGEFVDEVLVTWTGALRTQLYRVYRADNAFAIGAVLLGDTVLNSFVDDNPLYFQDEYFYFVTAVNAAGESIFGPGDAGSAIPPENIGPTDIVLLDNLVLENLPANSLVGDLFTVSDEASSVFTYTLGPDETDTLDYLNFTITGSELRSGVTFDFETQETYLLNITTTDDRGLSYNEDFTIQIVDVEPENNPLVSMQRRKSAAGQSVEVSWSVETTQQLYQLQMSETLAEDSWIDVGEPTNKKTFDMPMDEERCFFRVVPVDPAP